ncbi:NAD(P)H-dependent oxidoreductase [Pedobacter sp. GR22-10]|uniref:NAD(P)H-dependent oxidoreductase n=1 Tax=Pedobacter sp. GR22-10 TaxID=2994472 RepID=UPI0022451334|nr:NAD(P)H-dependent oxidoreductase [Pedobacter sp. GR22-10]MCX2432560.1 NAD(P)H-dependent oxidoreductase [Pedobacter sp. GR22-10]
MKTLIIVIHPDLPGAVVNKRWVEELKKFPDRYVIHQLHECYPDEKIDVHYEQQLVEQYDQIVFQFPYYWFNCPWLFKKWLDEVLTHGWAYGSKSGYKLAGKTIALAISVGVDEADYLPSGTYNYTLAELLRPFELSFGYVKADYQPPFTYYGIEYHSTAEWIEKSVQPYMDFLNAL